MQKEKHSPECHNRPESSHMSPSVHVLKLVKQFSLSDIIFHFSFHWKIYKWVIIVYCWGWKMEILLFEADNKGVADKLRSRTQDHSVLGSLLEGCSRLLNQNPSYCVGFY